MKNILFWICFEKQIENIQKISKRIEVLFLTKISVQNDPTYITPLPAEGEGSQKYYAPPRCPEILRPSSPIFENAPKIWK